jgi:putative DNA primase/helicase
MTTADHLQGILPHHLLELRASGLTDDTITANGIHSETDAGKLSAMLGMRKFPAKCAPAIVFPFVSAEGINGYYRIKPDRPRQVAGKAAKYESPRGRENEVYFTAATRPLLGNPEVELLFGEGEKKTLALSQHGFAVVGLTGVWNWKSGGKERLLPAIERIPLRNRKVYIVFDSDVSDNPDIAAAESRLAAHLQSQGAIVRVVRMPPRPGGEKMGADDFLLAHGLGEFRKLLDSAEEPAPVSSVELRAMAATLDPADECKAYLDKQSRDGVSRLRYYQDQFIIWNSGRYAERKTSEVRGHLIRFLNSNFYKLAAGMTSNVMDQLKAQAMLPARIVAPAWIGDPPVPWPPEEVLVTRNALVHLPSLVGGQECILTPTPRFFSTIALDYDFDQVAPAPATWLEFLNQLWPVSPDCVEALQQWFGYCLTADTRQQKILGIIGPTRSGKGTIARVQRQLIGPANVCGPALSSLAGPFGLWPLLGKSLAIISDARLGGRTDKAVIVERLLSISGEDAIDVDRKMLEPVKNCKLPTRLMVLSNELPSLTDSSGALTNRFILLQTKESFLGREDHDLERKLFQELPGILLWAIEGWRQLRERGRLTQPASSAELFSQFSDMASPMAEFVRERCTLGSGLRVAVADIFAAWQIWCESKGRRDGGTDNWFGRDLVAAFSHVRKVQPRGEGGVRYWAYEGIDLTDDSRAEMVAELDRRRRKADR